jgi:hypothetical protein
MHLEKMDKQLFFIKKKKLGGLIESVEKKITWDMLSINSLER